MKPNNLSHNMSTFDVNNETLELHLMLNLNTIISFLIILIGLVGNSLAICVFSKRRFRMNSSHIYLMGLAISDCLFLIVHLFEGIFSFFLKFNSITLVLRCLILGLK